MNKKKIKNILITVGGSDINKCALKIIKLLKRTKISDLKISLIKGDFFLKNETDRIKNFCFKNKIKI